MEALAELYRRLIDAGAKPVPLGNGYVFFDRRNVWHCLPVPEGK